MTGLAPEPVDRAIARILAGGLDDWRDITATVATPVTIERGHRHQQPADTPQPPAEPSTTR